MGGGQGPHPSGKRPGLGTRALTSRGPPGSVVHEQGQCGGHGGEQAQAQAQDGGQLRTCGDAGLPGWVRQRKRSTRPGRAPVRAEGVSPLSPLPTTPFSFGVGEGPAGVRPGRLTPGRLCRGCEGPLGGPRPGCGGLRGRGPGWRALGLLRYGGWRAPVLTHGV